MSEVRSSVQCVSAYYNIADDPAAGAIGNINTGTWIPKGSTIIGATIRVLTSFTGAGAKIGWNVISNTGAVITILQAGTNIAPNYSGTVNYFPCILLSTNFFNWDRDLQIQMVITTNPLTAGRCIFTVNYNTYDITS